MLAKVLPFAVCLGYGAYSIAEVFFPSIRNSGFNRWEVDEDSGASIQIMGWKKALSPPRVLASGYLSERAACTTALCFGTVLIAISVFGIRHVVGMPAWIPDLFSKFLQS